MQHYGNQYLSGPAAGPDEDTIVGPTTPSALPFMPLSGALPDGLQPLKIQGNTPASANPVQGDLFAVLLDHATIGTPAVQPAAPGARPVLLSLTPATTDELLPQTGNLLPQLIQATGAADTVPLPQVVQLQNQAPAELTAAVTDDTTEQAQILPLPPLPLEVQLKVPASQHPPVTQAGPVVVTRHAIEPAITADSLSGAKPAQMPTDIRTTAPIIATAGTEDNPALTTQGQTQAPVPQTAPQAANAAASSITIDGGSAPLPAAAPQAGQQQPALQATQTAPQSYQLHPPVADTRWGDALGQRLVWMTEAGIGRAEIRLNPPELGHIDVRVTVANDEARVAFSVQHGTTREALEAAMPRLRDMFAQQGIELTDASVSQHSPGEQQQADSTGDNETGISSGEADAGESHAEHESVIALGDSLIDTYA
ncbi:MAG: hypothetical protein HKN06_01850 [Gammaproteobacteria bacterium]|nr:hypothetical protein [Gammaproteobacteria bacterium]